MSLINQKQGLESTKAVQQVGYQWYVVGRTCGKGEFRDWSEKRSYGHSSSSRMRVINHNWSATKQHLHPQSVAEISCHSVLSGDRIQQCGTSSGSRHKDTDQCL